MKILITGATGFIGVKLCHRLVQEGHHIVALVRDQKKRNRLPQESVEILKGDLTLFKKRDLKLPPCDVIIHLAGKRLAPCWRENYKGLVWFVQCINAQDWKPREFIFCSSLLASGPTEVDAPKNEHDSSRPIEAYSKSKLAAENYLNQNASFPTLTLRVGSVFGEGDAIHLPMAKMALRGMGFKVSGYDTLFNYIDVDDLVEAVIAVLAHPVVGHKLYFVAHPNPIAMSHVWEILAQQVEKELSIVELPQSLFYVICRGIHVWQTILRTQSFDTRLHCFLTSTAFICSVDSFMKDFGWQPRCDIRQSFLRAWFSYEKAGWIELPDAIRKRSLS